MKKQLEMKFHRAMLNIYQTAKKELKYKATRFLQMLSSPEASVATAKKLVLEPTFTEGLSVLWENQRLDLTVEALVGYNEEFYPLFTEDEIVAARKKLEEVGYTPFDKK